MKQLSTDPTDMPTAPSSIAVGVGQAAVNATKVGKSPVAVGIGTHKSFKAKPDKNVSSTVESQEDKISEKTIAGYTAAELLEAPIKPPHPIIKDSKRETSNSVVKTVVFTGIILASLGLIFTFILDSIFGVILMLLGGLAIVACVFLPIGVKNTAESNKASLSSDGGTKS